MLPLPLSSYLDLLGRELRSRRSRSQIDAAWLTAIKNNCFANSLELSVPEWPPAVLCCCVTEIDDEQSEESVFLYSPFYKIQKLMNTSLRR